ncbi:hypothetical protein KP509_09G081000 [Ceratopteris richardii]|uniref:Uncharacterized protein n=1 Tax=Ceratopteris richardii TaxID=49495 RepID=A0A8T2UC59_CERRI|nr:hypothetical protein KP509_09G081000 [Ceratopteris richardii]
MEEAEEMGCLRRHYVIHGRLKSLYMCNYHDELEIRTHTMYQLFRFAQGIYQAAHFDIRIQEREKGHCHAMNTIQFHGA